MGIHVYIRKRSEKSYPVTTPYMMRDITGEEVVSVPNYFLVPNILTAVVTIASSEDNNIYQWLPHTTLVKKNVFPVSHLQKDEIYYNKNARDQLENIVQDQ